MTNEPLNEIEKLESDLWEAADNLRANSKLTSSDYFMPVLGVIFLRHAANRFEAAATQIQKDRATGKMPKREEGERKAELERREWEAQREQWRREEAERRAERALKESREDLLRIINGWAESNRIEQFFLDAERRAATLIDSERLKIFERLKRARLLVGSVDTLDHFMAWRSPDER